MTSLHDDFAPTWNLAGSTWKPINVQQAKSTIQFALTEAC
jgi:hypothetical protein